MHIPKRYGQSKTNKCPFCGIEAVFQNSQGIPVCRRHKDSMVRDLTCICGSSLEPRAGKFGPYFSCMKCGNVNFRRAMEINEGMLRMAKEPGLRPAPRRGKFEEVRSRAIKERIPPKETVVRSDELDFMYE